MDNIKELKENLLKVDESLWLLGDIYKSHLSQIALKEQFHIFKKHNPFNISIENQYRRVNSIFGEGVFKDINNSVAYKIRRDIGGMYEDETVEEHLQSDAVKNYFNALDKCKDNDERKELIFSFNLGIILFVLDVDAYNSYCENLLDKKKMLEKKIDVLEGRLSGDDIISGSVSKRMELPITVMNSRLYFKSKPIKIKPKNFEILNHFLEANGFSLKMDFLVDLVYPVSSKFFSSNLKNVQSYISEINAVFRNNKIPCSINSDTYAAELEYKLMVGEEYLKMNRERKRRLKHKK
ncbi:MAG: hypothetical protein KKG02_11520 [Candidatus Edwardsbacteria bacterium]|nr:hypothetical protein [Candidatus Edwardsbacteria bacterium]